MTGDHVPRRAGRRSTASLIVLVALSCLSCAERIANRPMNFGVVEEPSAAHRGMYRGGQPSPLDIAALRRELGVRTMIRLNRGDASADRVAALAAGVTLIEIPLNPKLVGSADGATRTAVERAFRALADPENAPVYVYCDQGRDRTGYLVALYRARVQGWSFSSVNTELSSHGHGVLMRRYLPHIVRGLAHEFERRERPGEPVAGGRAATPSK